MFEDEDEEIWVSLYENGHWEWDTTDEELKFIRLEEPTICLQKMLALRGNRFAREGRVTTHSAHGPVIQLLVYRVMLGNDVWNIHPIALFNEDRLRLYINANIHGIINIPRDTSSDLTPSHEDYKKSTTIIRTIEFRDDIDLWEQQRFRKRFQRKTNEDDVVTLQDVKDVVLYTTPSSILSSALINLLHLAKTEQFLRALILCCQYYLQISEIMTHRTIELETKIRTKNSEKIESKYREDLEDLRLLVANKYCIILLGEGEFRKYHHMGKTKSRSLSKREASLFEILICMAVQIVWIALGRKNYNQIELEINRILKSDSYNLAKHKLHTKYVRKMNAIDRSVLIGHCVSSGKKVNTRSPLINEVFCDRNIGFRLYGLGELKYSGSSRVSRVVSRKSTISAIPKRLYHDIYIPENGETKESLPDQFPQETLPKLSINIEQRIKWIGRIVKRKKPL